MKPHMAFAEKFAVPVSVIVVAIAVFLSNSNAPDAAAVKMITTTGDSDTKVAPDMVMVSVSIETQAATAEESQQENARISNLVMAVLEGIVPSSDIQTTQLSVYPVTEYDPRTGDIRQEGYRALHTIVVKTSRTADAGKIIDGAIGAGANRVDQVSFYLSEEKESRIKSEMLASAASEARSKAKSIADGLGVKIVGVRSAAESSFSVTPFYTRSEAMSAKDILGGATRVAEGEIEVSVSVTASFDIA